jgi:ribonuclease E
VASFLLNEKRSEIAKIELKQRINVLMVPNKTLETPNYKLERLKHDDPRLDHIEASYKMADDMEEATGVTRRSQEPTNKQTPVIKGVLPDAPAPVAVPKPVAVKPDAAAAPAPTTRPVTSVPAPASGGFFGWIKGLFGSKPAPAAIPVAAPVAKPDEKRDGRGARDTNRGVGRNEPRGQRGEPRTDQRSEGRGNRGGRGRGGEGRNGTQRDRFDADGKPSSPESVTTVAVDANQLDGNRSETRPDRAPRGDRSPRNGNGRGGERSVERNTESTAHASQSDVRTSGVAIASTPQSDASMEGNEQPREPREGGRGNRGGRGRRSERGPRQEEANSASGDVQQPPSGSAEVNNTELASASPVLEATGENREPREKRSRDRYGRDRGPRQDRSERTDSGAQSEHGATPVAALAQATPEEASPANTVVATTTKVAAPEPTPVPVAATPVAAITSTGMPKVSSSYALPMEALQQVASGSGLQWINTDADRVAAVQAAIAAEPSLQHVPRERPAAVVLDNRPLVLVETKRDLRNMTLPFEQDSAV